MRELYLEHTTCTVWTLTPLEVFSALCRLKREEHLTLSGHQEALDRLNQLKPGFTLIENSDGVKKRAERCLLVHPLKAADALQLAAALVACEENPSEYPFITLDKRLAEAAFREGFRVLPK